MADIDTDDRTAELEAELRQRDDKIKELTYERDEALEVVDAMREQIEDNDHLIENWKDAFDMRATGDGNVEWGNADIETLEAYIALIDDFNKLVRRHNRFVRERYPRVIGRPLAASAAQQTEVLALRKKHISLRRIAEETRLGLSTVRTITDKPTGKGRISKRTNELRRKEFDRSRAAAYRVRYKAREQLPDRIAEVQKAGAALIKEAKGLGRDR